MSYVQIMKRNLRVLNFLPKQKRGGIYKTFKKVFIRGIVKFYKEDLLKNGVAITILGNLFANVDNKKFWREL